MQGPGLHADGLQRIAAQQEKEELLDRETELSAIIQRLKDGKKSQRRTCMFWMIRLLW